MRGLIYCIMTLVAMTTPVNNHKYTDRPFHMPTTFYPPDLDCGSNATRAYCSSRCEETCKYKSRSCAPRSCGGPCVCRRGYIIDEPLKKCVLREDCSEKQLEVPIYQVTSVEKFGANYGKYLEARGKKAKLTLPTRRRFSII